MRPRLAALVGTLLLLGALGVPDTSAKTGDATCAPSDVWFNDAANDGGYNVPPVPGAAPAPAGGTRLVPAGELDIRNLTVSEVGTKCERVQFALAIGSSSFESVDGSVTGVTIKVNLAAEGTPEWAIVYKFGGTSSITLLHNGVEVTDAANITKDTNYDDNAMHISINKSKFVGINGFRGVSAAVTNAVGTAGPDNGGPAPTAFPTQAYTRDTATSTAVFLLNFGIDVDEDGMPDTWEKAAFGHLNQTGRTDSDGDGHLDVDEYLKGTDPTDPNSPLLPPAPYPRVTHRDTDGEFGMRGEYLHEMMERGQAYSFRFTEIGTYDFFCFDHKLAGGQIIVGTSTNLAGARTYVMEIYELDHADDEDGHASHGFRVLNGTQAGSDTLRVSAGDTVIFWNQGTEGHNVEAGVGSDVLDGEFAEEEEGVNAGYITTASVGLVLVIAIVLVGLLGRWKA